MQTAQDVTSYSRVNFRPVSTSSNAGTGNTHTVATDNKDKKIKHVKKLSKILLCQHIRAHKFVPTPTSNLITTPE